MIDFAKAFHEVVRIGNSAPAPEPGWAELLRFLESQVAQRTIPSLHNVAIMEDVRSVRSQLESILKAEPPAMALEAVYFGLFDGCDGEGNEGIGFYVAGVEKYDPANPDCLCNPAWWPAERYLRSPALDQLKRAELSATGMARSFLAYAGQIGVALLVARFASAGLFPGVKRIVGFDSGDMAELTA